MAKLLPTFLAQPRPAILHFCQRTAAPGTSGNYRGAAARTQVRYLGGAVQIMVTIGVSAHRSCADQFRLPQKYMLNPQQRAMKLFLVGIRFTQVAPTSGLPATAASRTPPWRPSGWGCRGRRLSRAPGSLDMRFLPWRRHQRGRTPAPGPSAPMRRSARCRSLRGD